MTTSRVSTRVVSTSGSTYAESAWQHSTSSTQAIVKTITDDGAGHLGGLGTISYAGKTATFKAIDSSYAYTTYETDFEGAAAFAAAAAGTPGSADWRGSGWSSTSARETMLSGAAVIARYLVGSPAPVAKSMAFAPGAVAINLTPYTTDRIVPGSVRFTWMGQVYEDQDGDIYRIDGASRIKSGTIGYATGHALMTDYIVGGTGPGDFSLQSLWTSKGDWKTARLYVMTTAAPVVPSQFTLFILDVNGAALTATGALDGTLLGDHILGHIDYQSGLVEMQFGDFVDDSALSAQDKAEWWYSAADVGAVQAGKIWRPWPIDPASLRYNIVSNLYLPVDPVILGLDPVRLPQDGRVPIYRKGRILVIGHNAQLAPDTYAASDVIDCGRTRLSHVWLIGADGKLITTGFTATESDLDAGLIHVTDVTGWSQPVTVEHRVQDMALCTDVQIDGTLGINIPLSHTYPVGSVVSSAVLYGTTFARVASTFDQQTWDGISWKDSVQGNPATGTYNDTAYPLLVTNAGALSDRYALRIKSDATTFELISEHMGTLGAGSINADFAPNSPVKDGVPTPLFTIKAAGWGGSWVAGNVVFLGIQAAMQSMAVIRTVQPGTPSGVDYSFDLLTGGDIDRPPSAP